MIELLILYVLYNKVLTMYGISKAIKTEFSVLTTPSIGTIKPALVRLEKKGFLKTQKTMSKGGRPSTFYSISEPGKVAFKGLILSPPQDNPIQFLQNARVRLYCANILGTNDLFNLIDMLRFKAESILVSSSKMVDEYEDKFYQRVVFDNIACEYKNFVTLLDSIKKAFRH